MALTPEQVTALRQKYGISINTSPLPTKNTGKASDFIVPKQSGFIAAVKDIPSDIAGAFKGSVDAVSKGLEKANQAVDQVVSGEVSPIAGTLKTIGAGLGAGAQVVGEAVTGASKVFLSPKSEQVVKENVDGLGKAVASTDRVQEIIRSYEVLTPEQKASIDGVLGSVEGLSTILGAGPGLTAVKKGISAVRPAVEALGSTAVQSAKAIKNDVVGAVGPIVQSGKEAVGNLIQSTEVSRIPSRIKTNIQSKLATEQAIKNLPTETAKLAVRGGIDIIDVRQVNNLKKTIDKKLAKELIDTVKKTQAGDLTKDPIEVVGKPIVAKIKELDKQAAKVGQKLSDVSKNLGIVTKPELTNGVFNRLKSVPGLKDLKLVNGKLDFGNTTIKSAFTKSDRDTIQKAFAQATKWGDGEKAHKFRQELFEILDGKKRSLENITGTQEKALQAIRQGLADVLESKNSKYKALNKEYASTVKPLTEIRKMIKANGEITEDILDMNAGLLARRLSSTSMSQGQVRSVLQALDKVSGGTSKVSTESLQDLYNILNRYYDIAPRTGFAGQTKSAIDGSIGNIITNTLKNTAGESDAVRQKALENLLNEILK